MDHGSGGRYYRFMKIGVLSDTHDNLPNIRRAAAVFMDRGIQTVLHGGDFCSPFTLLEFKPLADKGVRMYAVFGNNDGDKVLLTKRGEGICSFMDGAHVLELDGRRIVILHYPDLAEDLFHSGVFDLVVYGHNHQTRLEGTDRKLLNPGPCSGYLADKATIAVVDTADMAAEIIVL
jgi:putative phosphoesterase